MSRENLQTKRFLVQFYLNALQSGKTIQYVFILGYSRNYKMLCDRKNLADGRGGPLAAGGPMPWHKWHYGRSGPAKVSRILLQEIWQPYL